MDPIDDLRKSNPVSEDQGNDWARSERGQTTREQALTRDVVLPADGDARSRPRGVRLLAAAAATAAVVGAGALALGLPEGDGTTHLGASSAPNEAEVVIPPSGTPAEALAYLIEKGIPGCEAMVAGGKGQPETPPPFRGMPDSGRIPLEGFDCSVGYVDVSQVSKESRDPIPVYSDPEGGSLVGYWIRTVGWLPIEIVESPTFDLDGWLSAAQERVPRAVVAGE